MLRQHLGEVERPDLIGWSGDRAEVTLERRLGGSAIQVELLKTKIDEIRTEPSPFVRDHL